MPPTQPYLNSTKLCLATKQSCQPKVETTSFELNDHYSSKKNLQKTTKNNINKNLATPQVEEIAASPPTLFNKET